MLFSNPDIARQGGELEKAAFKTFVQFAAIVQECQSSRTLPDIPNAALTGLLFAAVHGLIDLRAGGRMRSEKGLTSVTETVNLLIDLLSKETAYRRH